MIDVEEILSKMNPNQKINYDHSYAYLLCPLLDLYLGIS